MMSNEDVRKRFHTRHKMIKALRHYLDEKDFIEVETPILNSVASGANARPFVTHHNANNADLFLRVAPELYLKQCVVGGLNRVYEIGKVFRNEGADRSHNPEFTSCEFYAAYHTYEDLIPMTEDILRCMATESIGTSTITVQSCVTGEMEEIDLQQPFRRVNAYEEVQRVSGVELPEPSQLCTPRGMAYMSAIMLQHNIPLPSVRTASKMFDKLIDYFITDRVVQPTFVMNHPVFMSPLAKESSEFPGLSERFELFINGMEYCNAYSELNDPQEQFYRFEQQLLDKRVGDDEAMALDETFLKALQVGLPPTAGWGMGIDRVSMLLNRSTSIRDEIIFPLLRQDADSHDAKRRRKTASFFGFNHQMTMFCLSQLEEDMIKRGASQESCEQVRHLKRCILGMERGSNCMMESLPKFEDTRVSRLRYDLTLSVLRLFCGSSKS
ncbi:lysyl-tRNA synthetase, class II [Angomonas deanei]|nr:lysyl-tRNA synthetase, class II [Angomonas deanei]|eukprot:EPY37778.1 lysyl-tRNA synthetase, class II [Angomonas deanei]